MKIEKFIRMTTSEKKYLFLKRFFPYRISSDIFANYLREKGVEIGKGTIFHDPQNTSIGVQRGWMIHIGDYCKITSGVTILDHDYSRSVIRRKYNDIVCEAGVTSIGNNVFVGINAIVLMGSTIGNNCIVGAGSIVNGSFPDDVVIAGNPARVIMTLEDFYKKKKERFLESGKLYCLEYYKKYGRFPKPNEMTAFFPLFLERTEESIRENNIWIGWNGDEENEILQSFLHSEGIYNNYDAFITSLLEEL